MRTARGLSRIGDPLADIPPLRRRDLARGDILFRQGDAACAIYRVESGRLRLERRTLDGRLVILHTARAGELFAEASLFADAYHCDAVATESSRVTICSKADVLRWLAEDPDAAQNLLATLARQLQTVRQRLELRNVRSARDRVLLWLELKAGLDRVVPLDGPIQDLAAELGLTRETLYRALAALEREGIVAREDAGIRMKGGSV